TTDSLFRRAHTRAVDTRQAAREFHAGVSQPDMAMVIFFCSSEYDLDVLAEELNRLFGDVPLLGCTTAGEIGPGGYCGHSRGGRPLPLAAGIQVFRRAGLCQGAVATPGKPFANGVVDQYFCFPAD